MLKMFVTVGELTPHFFCGATGLLRLWHPLKLSGSLVVGNGLADYSPVFLRYNMGFDHEIYTFRFFYVSHLTLF